MRNVKMYHYRRERYSNDPWPSAMAGEAWDRSAGALAAFVHEQPGQLGSSHCSPGQPGQFRRSGAITIHNEMRPVINCRTAVLALWYGHLRGRSAAVPGRVAHLKGNRVDASISAAVALGAQLHRFAVSRNDDVVYGVAITFTVLGLITGHPRNVNARETDGSITTVAGPGHQIRNLNGFVLMIRRPEVDGIAVQSNCGRRIVNHVEVDHLAGLIAGAVFGGDHD